jgi:transcriptional regulator with XRE-family HTH domain
MRKQVIIDEAETAMAALCAARESQDITQRELGERSGKRQPEISLWEHGHVLPTLPSLLRLAHALGYDLALVPREEPS